MSQITDIKPQKSSRGRSASGRKLRYNSPRFNIYLDSKFGFGLDAEILVKAGLKIDQVLSQSEIEKLVKENEFAKVYNYALKFISFRPRSEKELKDWSKRKEVGEEVKKMVWGKLVSLGYLNDEEFAKWWIEQRTTFKPIGKRLIEMELRQKGVSKEVISRFTSHVSPVSEHDLAKTAAEKRIKIWKNLPSLEFRQKLTSFLARRGFSWEIIEKVVDELKGKE